MHNGLLADFAREDHCIQRLGFRRDVTHFVVVDREIGVGAHDVHGVEILRLVETVLEIRGRDAVVDEMIRVSRDHAEGGVGIRALEEVGVFAGVAFRIFEVELGDAHVLVEEVEVLGRRDGGGLLSVVAARGKDHIGNPNGVGDIGAFEFGRLSAKVQVVGIESGQQTLRHKLVDVRDLLVAIVHGGIGLRIVFDAGTEETQPTEEK